MTTLIHENAPAPMVYAHKIEWPKAKGAVTSDNWYSALLDLQETRQARESMRDVWEWMRSNSKGAKLAAKADEIFAEKVASKPKAVPVSTAKPRKSRPVAPIVEKQCDTCGKAFFTNFSRKRFCSEECREQLKNVPREIDRKEIATGKTKTCLMCSGLFTPNVGNQKYCKGCAKTAKNKVQLAGARARYKPSSYNHTCAVCSAPFVSNRPDAKSCSQECRKAYALKWREAKRREEIINYGAKRTTSAQCQGCGKALSPESAIKGAKRCAPCQVEHKKRLNREYHMNRPKPVVEKQCSRCGVLIPTGTSRKYCDPCAAVADAEKKREFDKRRTALYKAALAMGVTA